MGRLSVVVCLILGVAAGVQAQPAEFPWPIHLEYSRTYATGEKVSFRLDESGQVAGTVLLAGGSDVEPIPFVWGVREEDGRGIVSPVLLRDAAALGATAESAPAGEAGVWYRLKAGQEVVLRWIPDRTLVMLQLVPSAVKPDQEILVKRDHPVAGALDKMQLVTGAAWALGNAWHKRGMPHLAAEAWDEAYAAFNEGLNRVPMLDDSLECRYYHIYDPVKDACKGGEREYWAGKTGEQLWGRLFLAKAKYRWDPNSDLDLNFAPLSFWPSQRHPAWPWDWERPAAGFEEQALSQSGDPTVGVRYARPTHWPKSGSEGSEGELEKFVGGAEFLGVQPVPSADGKTLGSIEFGCASLPADVSLLRVLHAAVEPLRTDIYWLGLYRRPRMVHAQAMALAGKHAFFWVAVQSGTQVACMRAKLAIGTEGVAEEVRKAVAQIAASLEPRPLSAGPRVQRGQEVRVEGTRLRFEAPAGWKEEKTKEVPSGVFVRQFSPPGDAPRYRLVIAVYNEKADPRWNVPLPHPAEGTSQGSVQGPGKRLGEVVVFAGVSPQWGTVEQLQAVFGEETLPVYRYLLDQDPFGTREPWDRVEVWLVCASKDEGLLNEGAILLETVASSFHHSK